MLKSAARLAIVVSFVMGSMAVAAPQFQYAEGQIWEYYTRPGDEGSLLRIQKIEQFDKIGPVYQVSVMGVHFVHVPLTGQLQHLPVSRQTLDASVTHLSASNAAFPDPSAGIAQWRAAKGGVFSISIAEIISSIEKTIPIQP